MDDKVGTQTVWGFVRKVSKGISRRKEDFHRLEVDTPQGSFKMICFDEATVDRLDELQDDALLRLTTKNTSRVYDATVVSARMPRSEEVAALGDAERRALVQLLAQGLLRQDSAGILRFGLTIQNILGQNSERLSAIAVDTTIRRIGANTPNVGAIAEDVEELDPTLRQGKLLSQIGLGAKPEEKFKARCDAIQEAIAQAKGACGENTAAATGVITALEALQRGTRDDAMHFGIYVDAIALARMKAAMDRPSASVVEVADRGVDLARKGYDFHLTTVANNQIGQTALQHAASLKALVAGTHQIATTTLPLIERQFQAKLSAARAHALDPLPKSQEESGISQEGEHGHKRRGQEGKIGWKGASIEANSVAHRYADHADPARVQGFLSLARVLETAQHLSPHEAVFASEEGALLLRNGGWGWLLASASNGKMPRVQEFEGAEAVAAALEGGASKAVPPPLSEAFLLGYASAREAIQDSGKDARLPPRAQKGRDMIEAIGWGDGSLGRAAGWNGMDGALASAVSGQQGSALSKALSETLKRSRSEHVPLVAAGAARGLLGAMLRQEPDKEARAVLAAAGMVLHADIQKEGRARELSNAPMMRLSLSAHAALGVAQDLARGHKAVIHLSDTLSQALPSAEAARSGLQKQEEAVAKASQEREARIQQATEGSRGTSKRAGARAHAAQR